MHDRAVSEAIPYNKRYRFERHEGKLTQTEGAPQDGRLRQADEGTGKDEETRGCRGSIAALDVKSGTPASNRGNSSLI